VLVFQGGSTLAVRQFHFTTWPDHGVPLYPTSLLAFHKKFCCCYDNSSGPTVIHCSAGVGRTGTFIALDYLLDEAKAEGKVDVFGCVCRMRNNRVNMVQTVVGIAGIYLITVSVVWRSNRVQGVQCMRSHRCGGPENPVWGRGLLQPCYATTSV